MKEDIDRAPLRGYKLNIDVEVDVDMDRKFGCLKEDPQALDFEEMIYSLLYMVYSI